MTTYQQKITFGEMRESGVRDVLIYCRDHRCSHHVETNADGPALRHRTELHLYALRQKGRGGAAEVFARAHGNGLVLARIGMMRALNRHGVKATPAPRRKRAKAYRIIR